MAASMATGRSFHCCSVNVSSRQQAGSGSAGRLAPYRADPGGSSRFSISTEVGAAYAVAGVSFPAASVDPAWDEFDLSRVYREIAPRLSAEDSEFRREYEEMREQVRISEGAHAARIHRKWLPCDTKLVEAWIGGRYPYSGETWNQFRERVAEGRSKISDARENILIVTSATPVAICTGLSLEISDAGVMRLAGAVYNASYTILRLRKEQLRLFTFNAVPHLSADGLRTHR